MGDALGAPVEFWSADRILRACPDGVRSYVSSPAYADGAITDDTQMTLFTVEGLIRAGLRLDKRPGFSISFVHEAYYQWYDTQRLPGPPTDAMGVLARLPWLYAQRAPGNTCMKALRASREGTQPLGERADNDSKGCGGVILPFSRLAEKKGKTLSAASVTLVSINSGNTHEETTVTTKGIATRTGICSPRYGAIPESLSSLHFQPTQRVWHDGNESELAEGGP
ncbi:MAG: ADP-ribosylglycohydrolase family protein [Pseudonocardia sp.]|nr:ADP-ribosylglycohydrolase family protein [Pseudonocardia sp.]